MSESDERLLIFVIIVGTENACIRHMRACSFETRGHTIEIASACFFSNKENWLMINCSIFKTSNIIKHTCGSLSNMIKLRKDTKRGVWLINALPLISTHFAISAYMYMYFFTVLKYYPLSACAY